MTTTTLTRSKLVTRDIKETMNYTPFGIGNVAVHVSVVVSGVDPFKSDYYAIMPEASLKKALTVIAKSKSDFPYKDNIKQNDVSWNWLFVTAAERKRFKQFPDDESYSNNAYQMVCDHHDMVAKKEREAHRKKVYTNAIKKDGANLVRFNHHDHTFYNADGSLIALPICIDYGIKSSEYAMKPIVDMFRKMDNVKMRLPRREWDSLSKEYPEITHVPHYNADIEGETEIAIWILPTDEQYTNLMTDPDGFSNSLWSMERCGVLSLDEFKLLTDD